MIKKYYNQLKQMTRINIVVLLLFQTNLFFGQEIITIRLDTLVRDSSRIIKATVFKGTEPMKETGVIFLADRLFMPVKLDKPVLTDDKGEADFIFPPGLPGDTLGNVTIITRLEDDTAVVNKMIIPWGSKYVEKPDVYATSLFAARNRAPLYLVIVSNLIIIGIWGTMGYVLFLLFFRMKKFGKDFKPE